MTLSELKFIVAVARERNFAGRRKKCFVSQPALSLAVKKLEEELGVIIFERSHKDVAMTPIGEQIIAQANRTLEESNRIKEIARMGNNQLAGPFKLGVIYSTGPYLLPEIIPALRKLAPEMPLEVEENLTANLETQLRNRVLDAAIIALPFDVPGVRYELLYDESFVVAVPDIHPWADRKEIHAEELADEKVLLLNSGHCFSNQVVLACPELSRHGEVLQGNSLETIRNMVASNLGITVLPCSAAVERYRNPLIRTIPFAAPVPTRRMALAWRKGYTREQAIGTLLQAIHALKSPCLQSIA